jgi:membrane protein
LPESRAGRVERADDFQRRHPAVGFPLAVVYKFFDDQANYLAATVTYYAFFAIFPLMLIASSVLGFLLQGDEELRRAILDSALAQFPIVGEKLGQPEGLQGSTSAVVVGGLLALYGVTNLGQAAVNALNVAWGIPRNTRLNPVHGRLRSLVLLVVGGVSVLVVALLPSLAGRLGLFAVGSNAVARGLVSVVSVALTALVLAVMMLIASSVRQRLRTLLPGAVFVAVLWHALQEFGGLYVEGVVTRVNDVNGIFAFVLGLIVFIYVGSVVAMLGIELNVVLACRLFPRALLTPFTDDVELTEADRRVYTRYAKAQRHKGFEQIAVTFERDDP